MTYDDFIELGTPVGDTGERRFQECPSCGDEKGHFYYNTNKGLGHCKKCGYAPNQLRLIRDLGLVSVKQAPMMDTLIERLNELDEVVDVVEDEDEEEGADDDEMLVPIPLGAEPVYHYHSALRYLLRRGLTVDDVLSYDLHYCKRGKYAGRIIMPVRDVRGKVVGFTTRGIYSWSSKPKYKTPSSFSITSHLYGADTVKEGTDNLIIVEGPFDKIKLGHDCIATFGKQMSRTQVNLLMDLAPNGVSLVYDGDARDSIVSVAALLSLYVPVKTVFLPDGEDPGSMPIRALRNLIADAPYYKSLDWSLSVLG